MGKLNATLLRYLSYEDIAVLAGVELGMKNHELVAAPLAASLSNLQYGGVHKILRELCKHRLLSYERGRKFDGYRLTNLGYDYLALHELTRRNAIASFGNQIGVGKESNIYIVANEDGEELCLKLHRLGRVCFRKVTEKRDYHKHAKALSWLYLSRISATKEFSYMTALYEEGFPVPRPVTFNRHCVIMELVKGDLLNHVMELKDPENLYEQLMDIIVRFASSGLIHGDFNEFNIMITENENPIIIDFPQMMSTEHSDAEMYFNRDVECIKTFFRKRFGYESELYPKLSEVKRSACLDEKVQCTGFTREMARRLNIQLGLEQSSEDEDDGCHENKESESKNEKENESSELEEETSSENEKKPQKDINDCKARITKRTKKVSLSNVSSKNSHNDCSSDECISNNETKTNDNEKSYIDEDVRKHRKDKKNLEAKKKNELTIEKWLSHLSVQNSNNEVSDSEDDCSMDEWMSKYVLGQSQKHTISKNNEAEETTSSCSEDDDFEDLRSVTSTATISQEEIKKRAKKKLQREKIKEARRRCLVKGEASAVRRNRKQNVDHIKQTKFLFDL